MNCPACDHANLDGARYCAKCGVLMPLHQADSADPMIGSVVGGRYRIVRLLGEGGMGRVYVGEQQMGTAVRQVAVKTLLQEFSRDPAVQGRFHRECGTVVGLEHANTIKFYDFGTTEQGDLYIAMEFVDGKPLSDVIAGDGRMAPARVENILRQICGSLHEAHEKGIIHRDLKPDNVILTERAGEQDFVKVLDFGIAKRSDAGDQAREQKLTQAGMVLGSPPYMSPEQFTGAELDRRSDVYSLGVMAYEMLAGTLPFEANTPWEWASKHMTAQPYPFERTTGPQAAYIPATMKNAILRALAKNREERQATAREFYAELSGGGTGARPGGFTASGSFVTPPSQHALGATQIAEPFSLPGSVQGGPYPTPASGLIQSPYSAQPPSVGTPPPGGFGPPAGHGYPLPAGPANRQGRDRTPLLAGLGIAALVGVAAAVWYAQRSEDHGEAAVLSSTSSGRAPEPVAAERAVAPSSTGTESADAPSSRSDHGAAAITDPEPVPSAEADAPRPPAPPPPGIKGNPGFKAPPPPPAPPSGCSEAIGAAMAGRCVAAEAAMSRCTGPERSVAQANILRCNQKAGRR